MRACKAVFLDRDGTLVRDVHFCRRAEDLQLLPGVLQAVRLLNERGFRVVVVTNQSGIGRGYFTVETLAAMHRKLREELGRWGAAVDAIYSCPHTPEDRCECRKPRPGMFTAAIRELGLNPAASYVVGDRGRDLEPGKALGLRTILVNACPGEPDVAADFTASSLLEAVSWIIGDGGQPRPIPAVSHTSLR
jgi:histidinol-phosphate phosphatase family protein